MAGRRKTPPGDTPPEEELTLGKKRVIRQKRGQEKLARARSKVDPNLSNESTRPSYREEYADQALRLSLLGHTNAELALYFEVSVATFDNWMADIPAFKASVLAGREEADAEVVNAMFQLAKGFEHESEEIFYNGKTGEVVRVPTKKKYPPNFNAGQLWLVNRSGGKWKMPNAKVDDGSTADDGAVTIKGGLPD